MILSGAFGGVSGCFGLSDHRRRRPARQGNGGGRNRRRLTAWDFREKPELLSLAKISAELRERKGRAKMKKIKMRCLL